MKALLLYNTASGRGRINNRVSEITALFSKAGYDVTPQKVVFSKNPFEGYEHIDLVVICGGDGTINFVINALKEKNLDPEIGIIPVGTANDFAYALGIKSDITGAAQQIINGKVRRVDCGKVNDKYFVNVLSFGVLTTTSQQTSDKEKHIIGRLAYLRTGFVDLLNMHSIPLSIKCNGEEHKFEAVMFLAFNGNSAGQFKLAPKASVDDGKFDILILDYDNKAKTFWNMVSYLINHASRAVHHFRTDKVELNCHTDERTDIDGQPGPKMPLSIECIAGALKIRA
jgi:YegS/Rv2252/BmrU family lipid kinase